MTSVRALRGAVASAVLLILSPVAFGGAATWPSRPISTISAVSAGNAGDTIARIVLDQVSKQIGQGFVLENRPGGGGTIGTTSVAKAEPDGYTVLLLTSSQSSYVVLHKTLSYDPFRDFAPVALFGVQPSVLVAAPSKGWKSRRRSRRGGQGEARRAELRLRRSRLGLALGGGTAAPCDGHQRPAHPVPRTGRGVHRSDDRARRLLLSADHAGAAQHPGGQNRRAGRQHAAARARAAGGADGRRGRLSRCRISVLGRARVSGEDPAQIVERLHAETNKALAVPAVRERLTQLGVLPRPMGVDEFTTFFHNEIKSTVKLAKDINLVPTN